MSLTPFAFSQFDPTTGDLPGATLVERRLSDLGAAFADASAYAQTLAQHDPLLYTVASLQPDAQQDALFYAMGKLLPGRIGAEYYMTKGHYHTLRSAPEVYIGLRGDGLMLLEDETGASRAQPLLANSIVYVPGHTAHRTINVGDESLIYLTICPLAAGHDYAAIARQNFRQVVICVDGKPVVVERTAFQPR